MEKRSRRKRGQRALLHRNGSQKEESRRTLLHPRLFGGLELVEVGLQPELFGWRPRELVAKRERRRVARVSSARASYRERAGKALTNSCNTG